MDFNKALDKFNFYLSATAKACDKLNESYDALPEELKKAINEKSNL